MVTGAGPVVFAGTGVQAKDKKEKKLNKSSITAEAAKLQSRAPLLIVFPLLPRREKAGMRVKKRLFITPHPTLSRKGRGTNGIFKSAHCRFTFFMVHTIIYSE
jgi:hypothetical protein